MQKTILLLLISLSINIADVCAQQVESQRRNSIRTNILPPLLSSTGEISYERLVQPNLGVVVGVGANLRADQSDFQLDSDADLTFLNRDIQNLYILAEVRRYIDFCDGNCTAPDGFYAGGFVRYNQLDYSATPQLEDENTNTDFDLNIELQSINFGALLGYQINYKNFLVDFEFGGIGYAPNWIRLNASSELSSEALADLSDALNENFGIGGNYSDIQLNSSSAETSFWAWAFRYAVSLGYNF